MSDVPKGWVEAELGEVMDVQGGSQPPKSNFEYFPKDGYVQLLQIRDFGNKPVPTYVPINKVSKFCQKEDILIARYGASLGRIVTGLEGAYNVALAKTIFDTGILLPRYVFFLLKTQIFQVPLMMISRSAQNGFAKHEIAHIKLPVPPLSEQKRIVEKIEELFSELEKGIESLKTAREQLRIYRRTLLKKLFDDEALKPKPLSEFVLDMGQGWSPKCFETPSPSKEIWGVIRTTAIQHLHFDESANKELPSSLPPREHLEIQENDILITRAGPRNRVGVACLVKKVRPKLILCDKAYRIKADEDQIIPEFLIAILNTPRAQKEIEELKSGISDSGLNLTQKRFLELEVRVPDIKVQQRLLDSFELQNDQIREAERTVEQQLISVEALRQSILKAAFSGRLVPQDPNDEPASVLLERIKADIAQKTKSKAKRSSFNG